MVEDCGTVAKEKSVTCKTRDEIEAEKALKPRPDLLPACAIIGAGRVMAYGASKHGDCTWRVAGTGQADPQTHLASAYRHLLEFMEDPRAVEEGSGLPVLYHCLSQVAIVIDLVENPPDKEGENDGRGTVTSRL